MSRAKALLATLLLTARVEEGLRERLVVSPEPPLPSDFKRRVLRAETLEDAFSSVTESRGPSEDPLLCTGRKRSSSFVYGKEPLLLTSSGNPLVKSKGHRHPPLDGQSRGGPPGEDSWSPPPLPSDFKRRVLRAETLEDAFSSVHKSLGVPLRDPLLCTGRKRSSKFRL